MEDMNKSHRDYNRMLEDAFRAEQVYHHKRKAITTCIKTRFLLKKSAYLVHEYMDGSSELDKIACNIFLTKYRSTEDHKVPLRKSKQYVKSAVKAYKDLDPEEKNIYRQAAVIDTPTINETVTSSGFHHFLALHVKEERKKQQFDEEHCYRMANHIWRCLMPSARLPFFMKGYLATFYPRDLDGSIMYNYENMSIKDVLNETIYKTNNDAENWNEDTMEPNANLSGRKEVKRLKKQRKVMRNFDC